MTKVVYICMFDEGAPGGFVWMVTRDESKAAAWAAESDSRWYDAWTVD